MRHRTAMITALLIFALIMATGLTGCGEDDGADTGITAAQTGATGTGADATGTDAGTYSRDVGDLASHADQVNSDYAELVDDYDAGVIDVNTLKERAVEFQLEFVVIVDRLKGMEVPDAVQEAHGQLIDGFGNWVRFYELQVEGLADGGDALNQARELDSQAAAQVNQAIAQINSAL